VRARTDGVITELVGRPGTPVAPGTPLAFAERPALEAEIEALIWSVRELEARIASELTEDRVKASLSRSELSEAREKLRSALERRDQLVVTSGASGLFTLAAIPAQDLQGRHMRKGDLIGYVTPPRADTARVLVPQGDIDLVRARLRGVELKLADRPERTFASELIREVPGARDELPSATLGSEGGGLYAIDPRDPNRQKTLARLFQFDVRLPASLADVPFGTRVHVRFRHDPEPLGFQIWRRARQLLLSSFGA
jgi:putative peptide zinc metalloprotease protein